MAARRQVPAAHESIRCGLHGTTAECPSCGKPNPAFCTCSSASASYGVADAAVAPEADHSEVDGGGGETYAADEDNAEAALRSAEAILQQSERVMLTIEASLVSLNADARRKEVVQACLEVRELCARVVVTMLECAQWAAVVDDPSMHVRFHVSATRPIEVVTRHSMQPALSRLYMRAIPLQAACTIAGSLGAGCTFAVLFGVPQWWLAILAPAALPSSVFLAACLNRTLLWNLATSFQPLFVTFLNLVMVVTFCVLWRNQPAKLAGFSAFLPTFLLAGFTDALPEIFRVPVSRVFFVLVLLSLLTLLAGIAFNRMGLEDFEVDLSLRTVKVSSVAAGVLTSLLPFAARNLGMIFLQPGVLPVMQSAVASVKLSSRALLVAKAKHTFAVLQVAHANKTMAKAERSISYRSSTRFSIRGNSMARDRADVSDHAAHLEGVLCAEDEEPQEPLDAEQLPARPLGWPHSTCQYLRSAKFPWRLLARSSSLPVARSCQCSPWRASFLPFRRRYRASPGSNAGISVTLRHEFDGAATGV